MGHLGAAELILVFMVLIPAVLWVIALIDILKNDFQGNNKIVWVLVVLLFPVLGAILYFTIGKSQRITT